MADWVFNLSPEVLPILSGLLHLSLTKMPSVCFADLLHALGKISGRCGIARQNREKPLRAQKNPWLTAMGFGLGLQIALGISRSKIVERIGNCDVSRTIVFWLDSSSGVVFCFRLALFRPFQLRTSLFFHFLYLAQRNPAGIVTGIGAESQKADENGRQTAPTAITRDGRSGPRGERVDEHIEIALQ